MTTKAKTIISVEDELILKAQTTRKRIVARKRRAGKNGD